MVFIHPPTYCPHGQGEGAVKQNWTGEGRGQKLAKMCGYPVWTTP